MQCGTGHGKMLLSTLKTAQKSLETALALALALAAQHDQCVEQPGETLF